MSAMPVEIDSGVTHRQLQAAHHVARLVPEHGCRPEKLRSTYRAARTGALHTPRSLAAGERVLVEIGLLVETPRNVRPAPELLRLRTLPIDVFVEALLLLHLTYAPGLWLANLVTADEVAWHEVPEDVAETLISTFPEEGPRKAFILNAARKFDQQALAEFGAEGEAAVVRACRDYLNGAGAGHLAGDVAQVSLNDDTLGYDVASPDTNGSRHRMEVKATSAMPGWVEFYISRNEATVGANDPCWSLVVARRELDHTGEMVMRVAGWLEFAQFEKLLATDPAPDAEGSSGRWASCRIALPDDRLHDGLPLDQRP